MMMVWRSDIFEVLPINVFVQVFHRSESHSTMVIYLVY